MFGRIIVTVFTYFLLLSTILFIVISGVGFNYFSSQLLFANFKINLKGIFGLGIGIGIFLFFMVWTFLFYPNFNCNLFFTFPITLIIIIVYFFFSLPISQQGLINKAEQQWRNALNEQIIKKIQYQFECCGWSNITDNGINPCPISFDTCCLSIFEHYIEPRFREIRIASIFTLILFVLSIVILSVYSRIMNSESLIEDVFLLNNLFEEE